MRGDEGDEELYKILRYVILFTVKTLKLTVTSTLGTLWEGAGAERWGICAYLMKTPGYALVRGRILPLKSFKTISFGKKKIINLFVKRVFAKKDSACID